MQPIRLRPNHLCVAASLLLASCATGREAAFPDRAEAPTTDETVGEPEPIRVDARRTDDTWQVSYDLPAAAGGLVFPRSGGGYRPGSWRPVSEDVQIITTDGLDVAVSTVPRRRFAFEVTPYTEAFEREYEAFVAFADGGTALHTGHLRAFPVAGLDEAEALGGDPRAFGGPRPPIVATIDADAPMIFAGRVLDAPLRRRIGGGRYVYYGEGQLSEGESFVGVVDQGLPTWLAERLEAELSEVFVMLKGLWGAPLPEPVTAMIAYEGDALEGLKTLGGAMGRRELMLRFEGDALASENDDVLAYVRWFLAHEADHLFQVAAGVRHAETADAWITEGGASAHALRWVRRVQGDAAADAMLAANRASCDALLGEARLIDAASAGRYEALYDCGAVLMTALGDEGVGTLLRDAAAEASEHLTTDDLLATLEAGGEADRWALVRTVLTGVPDEARAALSALTGSDS